MKAKNGWIFACFLVLIILSSPLLEYSANAKIETYEFTNKWDRDISGNDLFTVPIGIATDSEGNVYVVDSGDRSIKKFDISGLFVSEWNVSNFRSGKYDEWVPLGIAINEKGDIYVTDIHNNAIWKFNAEGQVVIEWGSYGTADGQFNIPYSVATDTKGNVYIADSNNQRIQKFDSEGRFISKWGSVGEGNGQFGSPVGIAIDNKNNVYVADYVNNNVQKFNVNGKFISKWSNIYGIGSGHGGADFVIPPPGIPIGIAADNKGFVYIIDIYQCKIQKFDSSGNIVTVWGSYGTADGQFANPWCIAIDSRGYVYVTEGRSPVIVYGDGAIIYNCRVQTFAVSKEH